MRGRTCSIFIEVEIMLVAVHSNIQSIYFKYKEKAVNNVAKLTFFQDFLSFILFDCQGMKCFCQSFIK